jgi:hypothetical protein
MPNCAVFLSRYSFSRRSDTFNSDISVAGLPYFTPQWFSPVLVNLRSSECRQRVLSTPNPTKWTRRRGRRHVATWKQGGVAAGVLRLRLRASSLARRPHHEYHPMTTQDLAGARSCAAARATGPPARPTRRALAPSSPRFPAGERAARSLGGGRVGDGGGRRQSLRAVAGAEAEKPCAYSRGFQIRAKTFGSLSPAARPRFA